MCRCTIKELEAELLSCSQAARLAGMTRDGMQWQLRHGRNPPPSIKVGAVRIFRRSDILTWLEGKRGKGAEKS